MKLFVTVLQGLGNVCKVGGTRTIFNSSRLLSVHYHWANVKFGRSWRGICALCPCRSRSPVILRALSHVSTTPMKPESESESEPEPEPYPAISCEELLPRVLAADVVLIDVRNRSELLDPGRIPNSLNLPLHELESALALSEDQFHDKYGFVMPPKRQELVLSCRSGKRVIKAADILVPAGYKKVRLFYDSFNGWVSKGAPVSRKLSHNELLESLRDTAQPAIDIRPADQPSDLPPAPLPGSDLLPIAELDMALGLPSGEFQQKYGFEKPSPEACLTVIAEDVDQALDALAVLNKNSFFDLRLFVGPLEEALNL